jgi:CBS domain-containing protein
MQARTVSDVMTRDLVSVDITDTTEEAARRMKENATGDVVVTDSGSVAGILTDRDIAVRLVAEGLDGRTPVGEITLDRLIACPPDAPLADVARLMRQHDVRRVPVVEDGHAIGIISLGDLAQLTDTGELLADISGAPDTETGLG